MHALCKRRFTSGGVSLLLRIPENNRSSARILRRPPADGSGRRPARSLPASSDPPPAARDVRNPKEENPKQERRLDGFGFRIWDFGFPAQRGLWLRHFP